MIRQVAGVAQQHGVLAVLARAPLAASGVFRVDGRELGHGQQARGARAGPAAERRDTVEGSPVHGAGAGGASPLQQTLQTEGVRAAGGHPEVAAPQALQTDRAAFVVRARAGARARAGRAPPPCPVAHVAHVGGVGAGCHPGDLILILLYYYDREPLPKSIGHFIFLFFNMTIVNQRCDDSISQSFSVILTSILNH